MITNAGQTADDTGGLSDLPSASEAVQGGPHDTRDGLQGIHGHCPRCGTCPQTLSGTWLEARSESQMLRLEESFVRTSF